MLGSLTFHPRGGDTVNDLFVLFPVIITNKYIVQELTTEEKLEWELKSGRHNFYKRPRKKRTEK